MINELVRAMLITIQQSEEYEQLSNEDKKRLEEIMQFVGGEEIDAIMEKFMNMPEQHYQIKITLKKSKPPIWRRVIVPDDYTFEELHYVIQEAMGWMDMHLYSFQSGNIHIEDTEMADDLFGGLFTSGYEKLDATETMIGQVLLEKGDKCLYTYDFGDDWEHTIELEKILPFDEELQLPVCIKGKRACPPEDCGGIVGYEEMLTVFAGPNNEAKTELLEWLGDDFNPEDFDIDFVNKSLMGLVIEIEEETI